MLQTCVSVEEHIMLFAYAHSLRNSFFTHGAFCWYAEQDCDISVPAPQLGYVYDTAPHISQKTSRHAMRKRIYSYSFDKSVVSICSRYLLNIATRCSPVVAFRLCAEDIPKAGKCR